MWVTKSVQSLAVLLQTSGAGRIGWIRSAVGAVARTAAQVFARLSATPYDFDAVGDGVADDTAAVTAWLGSGRKRLHAAAGLYKLTAQVVVPAGVRIIGDGATSDNATPGATCFLRAFVGADATILASGDDAYFDGVDVDNDNQGTGQCLQITGSRVSWGRISTRQSGAEGLRIGAAEAGASSINANLWRGDFLLTMNNASHGMLVDHTNTTTSGTFPLGAPGVNAGALTHLDTRSNGGDGLRVSNTIDNTFVNIVAQSNTGHSVRLTTSARGNKFVSVYSEGNTAGGMLFDSGATKNLLIGNSAVITGNDTVDSDGGNLIIERNANVTGAGGWYQKMLNLVNPAAAGEALIDFYADTGFANVARAKAQLSATAGGKLVLQTKADGGVLQDVLTLLHDKMAQFSGFLLTGKTAADTTTTGLTLYATAGRVDFVNSAAGAQVCAAFYDASGPAGNIQTSGAGVTTYGTSSDRRRKIDRGAIQSPAALVSSIEPRRVAFRVAPDTELMAMYAQDIQAVAPWAVTRAEDGTLQVDYSQLVPVLWAAVRELAQRGV